MSPALAAAIAAALRAACPLVEIASVAGTTDLGASAPAPSAPAFSSSPVAEPAATSAAAPAVAAPPAPPAASLSSSAPAGKLWKISFRPYPELFARGNDPLRMLRELGELGSLTVERELRLAAGVQGDRSAEVLSRRGASSSPVTSLSPPFVKCSIGRMGIVTSTSSMRRLLHAASAAAPVSRQPPTSATTT